MTMTGDNLLADFLIEDVGASSVASLGRRYVLYLVVGGEKVPIGPPVNAHTQAEAARKVAATFARLLVADRRRTAT